MKKITVFLLLAMVLSIGFFSCKKIDDTGDGIKIYTIDDDILNPPDSFLLQYNLKTNMNYSVRIRFGNDSSGKVWQIGKENNFNNRFWISRPSDDSTLFVQDNISIGLRNNVFYEFIANNNNFQDARKLIIKFKKLNLNYNTFNNKF
ncbi:MAG: hypothetical protein U5Q03_07630 [Bacteroidota bacterium]|nr:hypothetical protein [Bacteroidota bacterium]